MQLSGFLMPLSQQVFAPLKIGKDYVKTLHKQKIQYLVENYVLRNN